MPKRLATQIDALLHDRGSLTAAELSAATGKSQSSISLALKSLEDRVCKLGAARSTRYAALKPIMGLAARQPLWLTDISGLIQPFGQLCLLHNDAIHVRATSDFGGKEWLAAANQLPWFLAGLRPQGFLGRALRALRPDFPNEPDSWSVEQALHIAALHWKPPGAFDFHVVNEDYRWIEEAPLDIADRKAYYDQLATQVGRTLPARSSAGGEQPKFVAEIGEIDTQSNKHYKHLVVKFSPPRGTPFGERWHALLHLEQLAHQVLDEQGVAVAESCIVASDTRTYLESTRFDRVGKFGKRHVVAIDAIDREWNSAERENWVMSAVALHARGLIDAETVSTIARVFAYGRYIGNTDMHFGNLSFFVDDVVIPRIRLAPIYDMLPMKWRPSVHEGELGISSIAAEQPALPGFDREFAEARGWAVQFWERAAALSALDDTLRSASEHSQRQLIALDLR